jgi:translation initiation factor IF-2
MQQRQPRLGDILDDYCPRERRVTNHAVVAMVGHDVKQTRCTTCDAEHEYKHAKVPRQRRKAGSPAALYSQVLANGPKRVAHEGGPANGSEHAAPEQPPDAPVIDVEGAASADALPDTAPPVDPAVPPQPAPEPAIAAESAPGVERDEGPVHRPLIRASLPRPDGQPPQTRPIPEFTIRQPGGRPNRFRQRHQRGGQSFQGNRANGNAGGGPPRGGMRPSGGHPPPAHSGKRQGHGRKRSK